MVKYERKPVQYVPRPPILDPNAEVWFIEDTGEIFVEYEGYLQRRDFYKQRRFTCDVTGHSGLTFFEALESESEGTRTIDSTFPPPLREPVLRRVQFTTISRLDDLVSDTFNAFKRNFFPGEHVSAILADGPKQDGVIREAAKFSELKNEDGTLIRKAFSRYFVQITGTNDEEKEALLDEDHILRDRKVFSKQMLRSFLKATLTRESWSGAPWLVKQDIAIQYKIDTKVPERLLYNNVVEQRKANSALKNEQNQGTFLNFIAGSDFKSPKLGKVPKGKMTQHAMAIWKQNQHIEYQQSVMNGRQPSFRVKQGSHFPYSHFMVNGQHSFDMFVEGDAKPPRPPAIKYPIEDLDLQPKRCDSKRPQLKQLYENPVGDKTSSMGGGKPITKSSVGHLLEVWNTLNVLCEVFVLDSFTLDDLTDALHFTNPDVDCELFQEVHCSVLKLLVDEEGHPQISLPDLPDTDEEEGSTDDSAPSTPAVDADGKQSGAASRTVNDITPNGSVKSPATSVAGSPHRAAELMAGYGWIDRLKAKDFRAGGWQVIIIGLLYQLSLNPRHKIACDRILSELTPKDQKPTQETARMQYMKLDVTLRIEALQIITLLAVQTKAVRNYLEECSESMTIHRKEKIEWQRRRKSLVDDLREMNEKRKSLLQHNVAASPQPEKLADISMSENQEQEEDGRNAEVSEDGESSTRRSSGRRADLKRKREGNAKKEKEKQAKKSVKSEAANEVKQLSAAFKILLNEIKEKENDVRDCEEHVTELDNDLREANCQRTKILGRDRFWNRYMWFERNGMPFAGLHTSSTRDCGYANGRLWIQGPEEMERQGFIDLPQNLQEEYKSEFGVTVLERKEREEGATRLRNAEEWGYIDDPDALDALIGWLDDRGKRERELKKELLAWKEPIVKYMKALKAHLARAEERKAGGEGQATRVSTRTKTYIDTSTTKHRCLLWRNDAAIAALGHRHYDEPSPKTKNGKRVAVAAAEQRGVARVVNGKAGKMVTRKGTRYGRT